MVVVSRQITTTDWKWMSKAKNKIGQKNEWKNSKHERIRIFFTSLCISRPNNLIFYFSTTTRWRHEAWFCHHAAASHGGYLYTCQRINCTRNKMAQVAFRKTCHRISRHILRGGRAEKEGEGYFYQISQCNSIWAVTRICLWGGNSEHASGRGKGEVQLSNKTRVRELCPTGRK